MMANKRRHLIFDKVYFGTDRKTDVDIDSGVCLPWDAAKRCQRDIAEHNIFDLA